MVETIGQILGFIAVVLNLLTYQMQTKNKLLLMQTATALVISVHYFMIGATSGAVLNMIAVIRNLIYYDKKHFTGKKWVYIMTSIMALGGILSAESIWSFLVIIGLVLNSYALSLPNPKTIRKIILISTPCVLVYDIIVWSLGGTVLQIMSLVSVFIGIYREKKEEKKA